MYFFLRNLKAVILQFEGCKKEVSFFSVSLRSLFFSNCQLTMFKKIEEQIKS